MSRQETVYGLHAVGALLARVPERVQACYVERSRDDRRVRELERQAEAAGVTLQPVDRRELDRMAGGGRHQGVVARIRPSDPYSESYLEELLTRRSDPFLLLLDQVQDPHNLGACLRTADAAGVHAVIAPKDRACGLNPTVRKVASGAAETVPFVHVTNISRTLKTLRHANVRTVGADAGGDVSLFETDLRGPLALVLGAEGQGLRRLTRENCDTLVRIPMTGSVASLNVSVAAGVMMFEALRQRTADLSRLPVV